MIELKSLPRKITYKSLENRNGEVDTDFVGYQPSQPPDGPPGHNPEMCRLLRSQDGRKDPAGAGVDSELLEVAVLDHVLNQELDGVLVTIFRDDLTQEAEVLMGDFFEIVK